MKKSLEQIQEEFQKINDEYENKIDVFFKSLDEESKKDVQYYCFTAVGDMNGARAISLGTAGSYFITNVLLKEFQKRVLNENS